MINPYSTGLTLQLIPKAAVDKIPILSMAYGLSASAEGNQFPWIFNPPDTYWDGASAFMRHAANAEGGFDKLKGKKIGLLYLDAPYGKEPIPLLQSLAKDYGFTLKLYPVPASEMQNQGAVWLDVRRDRPDWIFLQGWGARNPTAIKAAAENGFPMDRLIGNWWSSSDDDARPAGAQAKGYGHNVISVVQWDGMKWTKTSESLAPIKDKVMPLIESAADDYVKANAGWPKRTEACDRIAAK